MEKAKQVFSIILASIILLTILTGCAEQKPEKDDFSAFASFRDIPGVTSAEKAAIEELQNRVDHFVYGVNHSTEAFQGEDGTVRGFAALFCQWLSELFEIPFVVRLVEWDELVEGLEDGTIDFSGELTANAERRLKYFMTDDTAQRQIIYVRLDNSITLQEIAQTRPLRYAFFDGSTTEDDVRRNEINEFETFYVDDYDQAYEMLLSGEADAFFDESPGEAAFDFFGEVYVDAYFPIIYSPVSLSTQNPEFKYIIDVVDKALASGAIQYLTSIYNQGLQDYKKHKLFTLLTDEEREYIKNTKVVMYAAEITNYPVSFYDTRTRQWEGIALEVIDEIERLTGIHFERRNDENTHWPVLLAMLESGEVSMVTELIPSENRKGNFLWAGEDFFLDNFVLVSKSEFHDISINEILYVKTGVANNTAHSVLFHRWFPNHRNVYDYDNTNAAFDALERGEIEMVMTSEHQLLIMTNYRELVGYKANYVFPFYFNSTFGFNKDEAILSSIVTKAMRLIDIDGISGRWLRRTYDYRVKLAQDRIPYMIGVGMLSVGLIFSVILFIRKRREGLRLETLVDIRTSELSENQQKLIEAVKVAQEASRAKSEFLANMSHEIRTPMNAILGMSEILEHEELGNRQMGFVKDISSSAHSLLGIINDILDMSKIEAGKLELIPVDYSFNQFLDHFVSMFTLIANKKDLEFLFETEGDMPEYFYGDDIRLRQVLTNICGNAIKFTEAGHVKLTVTAAGDKLMLRIEDTGPGIKPADIPKLFRAFEQVDTTVNRNKVGTGLGLPICKSFVEMMNGEITVESEYGAGSAFTVTIPIVIGNPENIQRDDDVSTAQSISAPEARILVTDDNDFNLKVATGLLRLMGIDAETADSGAKAIELVKLNDYDIVFMDHMMPEMDGIETTQRIRGLGGKYEDLTIIALTANAIIGAREMFFSNGFNDFIAKPIDTGELREIIIKYLPPEKVKMEIDSAKQKERLSEEEELNRKALKVFYEENETTSKDIADALSSGDIKKAHRIAHTLKSSAGFLEREELQEAAFSLEMSLQKDPPEYTAKQLDDIERELEIVLRDLAPLIRETESEKPTAVQISAEEMAALQEELRPLLEKGDFAASSYVERLRRIAGMEALAERIDDYDFEGALKLLD